MFRPPKPDPVPPTAAATEVLAEILRLRTALIERDRELLPREIELWQSGAEDADAVPEDAAATLARELMNGFATPVLASANPGAEIKQIRLERRAIGRALDGLQAKEVVTSAAALVEVMQAFGTDWIRIQQRRAAAIMELRQAEEDAEAFRVAVALRTGGQRPALVGDLGIAAVLTPHALKLLETIQKAGIA